MADTEFVGPQQQGMPAIGEVRTVGAETRRWDGQQWKLVPRTFMGTEDFTGRMREYAKPLLKTMGSDLAQPVLHPIDTASGLASLLTPSGISNAASGIGHTLKSAATEGDPESVGHILSALAAPKVYDKALSGTNAAAHAVAENPSVRSGVGYVGGAGGALAMGGHPFIGGVLGRITSPLLQRPAEEVANATDWLKDAIHGKSLSPELRSAYADLLKTHGKDIADRWLKQQAENPTPTAAPTGTPPKYPIKPQSADTPVDALTGETADGWKQRMAGRLGTSGGDVLTDRLGNKVTVEELRAAGVSEAAIDRMRQGSAAPKGAGAAGGAPKPPQGAPPAPSAPPPKPAAPPEPSGRSMGPEDPAISEIVDRMAGGPGAPSVGNGKPDLMTQLQESLTELRRRHGADRIGRVVSPGAPEAGTGTVLRADASEAPSAMPDVGQEALLRDLKNGTTKDPGKTLRAISQLLNEYKRNAGPANSNVARELADLLKKNGFDVP